MFKALGQQTSGAAALKKTFLQDQYLVIATF
jgi:hypothetical protein